MLKLILKDIFKALLVIAAFFGTLAITAGPLTYLTLFVVLGTNWLYITPFILLGVLLASMWVFDAIMCSDWFLSVGGDESPVTAAVAYGFVVGIMTGFFAVLVADANQGGVIVQVVMYVLVGAGGLIILVGSIVFLVNYFKGLKSRVQKENSDV